MPRGRKKTSTSSRNKIGGNSKQAIEQMKYEIANELGISMGPNASSRLNGSVGGEITKRLIKMGESQLHKSTSQK